MRRRPKRMLRKIKLVDIITDLDYSILIFSYGHFCTKDLIKIRPRGRNDTSLITTELIFDVLQDFCKKGKR